MNKRSSLFFIFFFISLFSSLFAMALEQSEKETDTQMELNLKVPEFRGLENVIILAKIWCPSTIRQEVCQTYIYVRGRPNPLIYRGNLQRFRIGNRVSIIYENIEAHGQIQSWIHLIDKTDLNSVVNRWKQGECCCRSEQFQ
jgi:hypothetical protein